MTTTSETFGVGSKVHLRGARFGQPGTVVKLGKRLTVYWGDLDFLSKHQPASLALVEHEEASMPKPTSIVNATTRAGRKGAA